MHKPSLSSHLQLLDQGSNSVIYTFGTTKKVALKIVSSKSIKEARHLRNEASILKQLRHEHIVRMVKFNSQVNGEKENDPRHVLVLQYAQEGNLLTFIRQTNLKMSQKRGVFAQICEAVHYLHERGICHRDIKMENILMFVEGTKVIAKIADFGFASTFSTNQTFSDFKGTFRGYMAPQIHRHRTEKNVEQYQLPPADIFALGVTLFAVVFAKLPFQNSFDSKIYNLIKQARYEEFWNIHSFSNESLLMQENEIEEFKDLLIGMIDFDPKLRFTIVDVLKHKWMSKKIEAIKIKK